MLDAAQLWLPTLAHEPAAAPLGAPRIGRGRRRARAAPASAQASPDLRASRRAYLGVVARWSLSAAEALALLGEPLCDEHDRHERLRGLLGAHRSLLLLAPDPARCAKLLRDPSPALDGLSMLQVTITASVSGACYHVGIQPASISTQ